MDLQLLVALNAMTVSALVIAMIVIYRPRNQPGWLSANGPWLGVNGGVLALGTLALLLVPAWAGTAVAVVFIPFVAAPMILFSQSLRQAQAGHLRTAAWLARGAAWTHPTLANRMHAKLATAMAGNDEQNAAALAELAAGAPREYRPFIQAQRALLRRDWSEVLAIAGARDAGDTIMKPLEIRALGETGRTDAMVQSYLFGRSALIGAQGLMPRLVVLAFGGRPGGVAALLAKRFSAMDEETKSYWIGLARLHSSLSASGERVLVKLSAEAKRESTRLAARRQLNAFVAQPRQPLLASTEANLDLIEQQTLQETLERRQSLVAVPVTLGLIAVNLLAFAAEVVTGGSEDSEALINLGALWPPDVFESGEWWRLLTASFLHFGPIHLLSNMFVLWVLGRLLEPMLGAGRTLFIYLAGAVLSSAFVLWLMAEGYTSFGLLVGASGAIFALLGAETLVVLQNWWRDPEAFDRRKFSTLAVILGLQIVIDLSVPNVSFAAHVSGFFAGMLALLVVPIGGWRRTQTNSSSGA